MNYHSTVAEVIKHGMMTVVDSAQECDKIKMVQQQLESHSFPFNTGQPLAQDAAALKIKNPPILIRIKPSKLAGNKVEVSMITGRVILYNSWARNS